MAKLGKRNCKECGVEFQKKAQLDYLCGIPCAIERARRKVKADNEKKRLEEEKEIDSKVKAMRPNAHATKYKKALQDEINLLSRKIDAKFGFNCIDCGKPFGDHQRDACHLISRGKNSTLKYHLHNLHSGHNHCNVYNTSHEHNYKNGLLVRYGRQYLEMVESLPLTYKEIHLTNNEIVEKLALVRKINRTFDTYLITSGDTARELFNKLIGIYG